MVFTGNIQISSSHLSLGRDILAPSSSTVDDLEPYVGLARVIRSGPDSSTLAVAQLSHAGRQSPNIAGGRTPFARPSAPSPIPVGTDLPSNGLISRLVHSLLFQTPHELSLTATEAIIQDFVNAAVNLSKAGFDGVQLHCAHGCGLHTAVSIVDVPLTKLYKIYYHNS